MPLKVITMNIMKDSFAQNDFELLIVMKRFWISGNANSNNKRVEVSNSDKRYITAIH